MCGIFTYFGSDQSHADLWESFMKIQHRGPDHSDFKQVTPGLFMGFHRLAINGLDHGSDQPMALQDCVLVANAEIFNYRELAEAHGFELQTHSDCEVIIHLYRKLGFKRMVETLDGEFALALYDLRTRQLWAARDQLGVRGMYIGRKTGGGGAGLASEAKALTFMDELQQFPPGHIWNATRPRQFERWYTHEYAYHEDQSEEALLAGIRHHLTEAVRKRLLSDRPIGCLLSGGLDSSLVSALVCQLQGPVETFSIGMKGSPDLYHAQMVADHIGSIHHNVELEEQDFLDALEETVYLTGSFDVTTIRASVGHQLISQYVRDHSDVKVLFSGETIDEMGSYLYFQNAPSPAAFQMEALRLLQKIHYFDMLRGDRSISSAGLEARVPFADKAFLHFYMGIRPDMRMFDDSKPEKYLLRKAFEAEGLLPPEVLWRRKNGFSDSVSQKARSWSTIIQEKVNALISDEEFEVGKKLFRHDPPRLKEGYYYRQVFSRHYGRHQELIPFQWLPRWCGEVADPSARVLSIYEAD